MTLVRCYLAIFSLIGGFFFDIFLGLLRARLVGLGVKDGDKVRCASFTQGIDNLGDGSNVVLKLDQPTYARIPTKADCVFSRDCALNGDVVGNLELVLGEEDICSPLEIAAPLGLALPTEMNSGFKVLGFDDKPAISNWVKYKIPSFSKLVGLPMS